MTVQQIAFFALSAAAVIGALVTILARNPVHSGAMLVFSFFNVAGLFVLLGAEFLATAMVIIYGGAIMVLVVFVLMLVRLDDLPEMHPGHPVQMVVAPLVGLAAFLEVVAAVTMTGGVPLGVFRSVSRPVYEDLVDEQVRAAVEQRGEGDLAALLQGADTWTIG